MKRGVTKYYAIGLFLIASLISFLISIEIISAQNYNIYFNNSEIFTNANRTELDKVSLSINSSGSWLILFSAEINQSKADQQAFVYFKNSNSKLNSFAFQPDSTTNSDTIRVISSFYIANVSSSETFYISFNSSSNTDLAGMRRAKISAIRIDIPNANYFYNQTLAEYTLQDTAQWEKSLALNFSLNSSGDYLILASGELTTGTGNPIEARVSINNSSNFFPILANSVYYAERIRDNTPKNYASLIAAGIFNFSLGNYSISLDVYVAGGTASNFKIRNRKIILLKLDNVYDYFYNQTTTEDTTTNSSYVIKDSLSFSSRSADYIVLGGMFGKPNKNGNNAVFAWDINKTGNYETEQENYFQSIVHDDDYMGLYSFKGYNFNNQNISLITKYRTDSATKSARIKNSLLLALTYPVYDSTPPNFSNFNENPLNNSAYSANGIYRFNISVLDDNAVNKVGIEFNGVNYTNGNISNISNIYIFNISNLASGTYSYRWWANDSYGNFNSTELRYYTINKANSQTSLSFDKISPQTYGILITPTCNVIFGAGIPVLMMDGNIISSGTAVNLAGGNHNFNCSLISTENYSYSENITNFTINKASGEVRLFLNGIEDNLTIDYPEQYNVTAKTSYGNISIYKDGVDITGTNGQNTTPLRNVGYYNITAVSLGNENHSSLSLNRWLNVTLDLTAPIIEVISPQEGGSYGYNVSLELNYSVSDIHLSSCWYNINNGNNISLENCQNTIFNLSSDGNYVLNLYANDSLGNIAIKNTTFSILVGAPTIVLTSPIGIYLNNPNVTFRYIPSDIDIESCELWGDFTGVFALNQTNNGSVNNVENTFDLNLPDGAYKWNVRCNDSMGNFAFNGNKTFYVDTTDPAISISEPKGTKESWLGILLIFITNDSSPVNCKYIVSWSTGGNVISNTSILNCSSIIFNLSSVGDYVLSLFVNDIAGNFNSANSSFTISSSNPPLSGGGSSSGGSGGGGPISPFNKTLASKLELSKMENIIAHAGDKKTLSLSAKNTGKIFLNNCKLSGAGNISRWLNSKQAQGISPGENINFIFELNVPEDAKNGDFSLKLRVNCDELEESSVLDITIPAEFQLIKIKEIKQNGNFINIIYDFDGSRFPEAKVEVWIVDEFGIEVKRIEDKFITGNRIVERNVSIEFSTKLVGIYSVYAASSINLEDYAKQSVIFGKSSGTGFTILDQPGNKMIVYVVFLLIIGAGIFLIVWNSRKNNEFAVKGKRKIKAYDEE